MSTNAHVLRPGENSLSSRIDSILAMLESAAASHQDILKVSASTCIDCPAGMRSPEQRPSSPSNSSQLPQSVREHRLCQATELLSSAPYLTLTDNHLVDNAVGLPPQLYRVLAAAAVLESALDECRQQHDGLGDAGSPRFPAAELQQMSAHLKSDKSSLLRALGSYLPSQG